MHSESPKDLYNVEVLRHITLHLSDGLEVVTVPARFAAAEDPPEKQGRPVDTSRDCNVHIRNTRIFHSFARGDVLFINFLCITEI